MHACMLGRGSVLQPHARGTKYLLLPRSRMLVQDTLRGPVLASIPYFDQKKVVRLLDSVEAMDEGSRVAVDQVLMLLLSACVLHEGFHMAASTGQEQVPRLAA